jgi:dephospho-CoA kinase
MTEKEPNVVVPGPSAARVPDSHSSFIRHRPPLVVGIVGGIGSGKSSVTAEFAHRGARVIQGDQLGHEALRQPDIRRQIVRRWGAELLDEHGEIQRRRLGAIVFSDPQERKALEALTHPWILRRIGEEVIRMKSDPQTRLIVVDAAILLEAGWNDVCDHLIYVDAPIEVRLERVARQRGWATQDLEAREHAQLPLTEKRVRADHVLDNSSSMEHLGRQVDDLMRIWGLPATAPPARHLAPGDPGP